MFFIYCSYIIIHSVAVDIFMLRLSNRCCFISTINMNDKTRPIVKVVKTKRIAKTKIKAKHKSKAVASSSKQVCYFFVEVL